MSANPVPNLLAQFYDLSVDTTFIAGEDLRLGHGVYPRTLNPKFHLGKMKDKVLALETARRRRIVIWFPEDINAYPLLSGQGVLSGVSPNGGARMDLDYPEVATFAVYSLQGDGSYALSAWYDFDHWPGTTLPNGRFTLDNGLADGHYHPAGNTSLRRPCNSNHRLMLLEVVAAVRSRNILGWNPPTETTELKVQEKH